MILYNIRANGPYEYDKFTLNIFQIINLLRDKQRDISESDIDSWLDVINKVERETSTLSNQVQTLARKFLY